MGRFTAERHLLLLAGIVVGLFLSSHVSTAHLLADQTQSPSETSDSEGETAERWDLEPGLRLEEAAFLQPISPVPAERAVQPAISGTEVMSHGFGSATGISRSLLSPDRSERARGPSSDVISGSESSLRVTTDAGNLLGKSPLGLGLGIQRRTPIVTDARIRGHTTGQQMASGSYWFPARQDLDTMLSKIDSRIVQDVIVIKGPYSVLYGPGFSFYDVELLGSPRYPDGREVHGSTGLDYQTNGQQFYGRQNVWGGSDNWGFRVGYGHRTGNDYETGNGTEMPSSYKSRDLDVAFGINLSPDSHLEFSYLRLDQTDVEFPAQAYDMDFLVTDGYELTYVLENQSFFDRLTVDTWYNRTRFEGDSQRSGKHRQIPQLDDPLHFVGFTDVDAMSTGFRLATSWGERGEAQLTTGVDLRRLTQRLNETDLSPALGPNENNFPIPPCDSTGPGVFGESVLPINDRFTIKIGTRADWVSTDAERFVPNTDWNGDGSLDDLEQSLGGGFSQNFTLGSAFLTADYELDPNWTAVAGFGCAMRPPTLTELYAAAPFLAILQQGFTKVLGTPGLAPERIWQIDLGLNADYERFRGYVRGFHAWIEDYITFRTWGVFPGFTDPTDLGPLLVRFINTDLATLVGGEAYGEYDCSDWLTGFGTITLVEGRDQTRGVRGIFDYPGLFTFSPQEPLPGIAPLESRLGLRVHDPNEQCQWAVELSARIVDNQDRVASSLIERDTPGFTTYDLRGYWHATDSLMLIAGVENLTDKHYREHLDLRTGYGVYQPGRSFYFGTELQY